MKLMTIRNLHVRYQDYLDYADLYNCLTKVDGLLSEDFQISISDNLLHEFKMVAVVVLVFTDYRRNKNNIDLDLLFDYLFIGFKSFEKRNEFLLFMKNKTNNLDFQILQ